PICQIIRALKYKWLAALAGNLHRKCGVVHGNAGYDAQAGRSEERLQWLDSIETVGKPHCLAVHKIKGAAKERIHGQSCPIHEVRRSSHDKALAVASVH